MHKYDALSFVKVTSDDLLNFIKTAKERIIFAKPAFTEQEIKTIMEMIIVNNITCSLFIEAGDKPIRYGFGDSGGLELINKNLDKLNIQIADRIRMAILIIDERTLVYSPNIAFVEEETKETSFPNGFFGNEAITHNIIKELYQGGAPKQNDKIIPFPGCDIPNIKSETIVGELQKTIDALSTNPAVDPSKLRTTNFYRHNYKLLKIQVMGIKIENKKISLRSFLALLSTKNEKDIRSWGIFNTEDIKRLQDTLEFMSELEQIENKYLLDAGRFGFIISIEQKEDFQNNVKKLQKEFTEYFKGAISNESENRFCISRKERKQENQTNLSLLLNQSKSELFTVLEDISKGDENFIDAVCQKDRQLSLKLNYGTISTEEVRKEFIDRFITNNLKFPTERDMFDRIDVRLDYYDISDELIYQNSEFQAIIEKYKTATNEHGLKLRNYEVGYKQDLVEEKD